MPLCPYSLLEGVAPPRSSLLWSAWLAAQEAMDQLVAGSLEKGSDGKRGPHLRLRDVLVDKLLLLLCSHSSIFVDQCPQRRPGLLTYSTWLLLAAPAHKCCFRIKELGTIETGSGPADESARPVQLAGPWEPEGPRPPEWWLTHSHDRYSTFQGRWAISRGPVGRSKCIISTRPFCLRPTVLSVQNQSSSSAPFVSSSAFPFLPLGCREHLVIPES